MLPSAFLQEISGGKVAADGVNGYSSAPVMGLNGAGERGRESGAVACRKDAYCSGSRYNSVYRPRCEGNYYVWWSTFLLSGRPPALLCLPHAHVASPPIPKSSSPHRQKTVDLQTFAGPSTSALTPYKCACSPMSRRPPRRLRSSRFLEGATRKAQAGPAPEGGNELEMS